MFLHSTYMDGSLEILEIKDGEGTFARFAPGRGGMLVQYTCNNVPLFYLDSETLHDTSKNVRGGNPVLFPFCGPVKEGRYRLPDGREYFIKQHGFARDLPWEVLDVTCQSETAAVTLQLKSSSTTRDMFPFDFSVTQKYVIRKGEVSIIQEYLNESSAFMPLYPGFHPYFYAPNLEVHSLKIPSEECFDIKGGRPLEACNCMDLDIKEEFNLAFTRLNKDKSSFERSDGYRVTVKYDSNFTYIVTWALPQKEFFCLEPWMGGNYDINRNKARILEPGAKLKAVVSYLIEKI